MNKRALSRRVGRWQVFPVGAAARTRKMPSKQGQLGMGLGPPYGEAWGSGRRGRFFPLLITYGDFRMTVRYARNRRTSPDYPVAWRARHTNANRSSSLLWRFISGLLSGIDCIRKEASWQGRFMKLLLIPVTDQGSSWLRCNRVADRAKYKTSATDLNQDKNRLGHQ